jgi:hypothetical protein
MPIDFSAIAEDWLLRLRTRQRSAEHALALLGPWLAERLERLGSLERRSRGWPTWLFEGRALSVRLAPAQVGAVRPYGSVGPAFAAPFVAFGRSFVRIPQAAEEAWILPALFSALDDVVGVVESAVARWARPRAGLFEPGGARASDLFGIAAMAWRGLGGSLPALRAMAVDFGTGMRPWLAQDASAAQAGTPPSVPAAPETGSTGSSLERYLVAAILVLPVLPSWIENLARAAWLRARVMALDVLQGIEARVFRLRTQVLTKILLDLPRALREVPAIAAAMGAMLAWSIRYFARLAQVWMDVIVFTLNLLLRVAQALANAVIGLINGFLALVDRIMKQDLLQYMKPLLGPTGYLIDMLGVRLSLDDLIEAGTQAINFTVHAHIKGMILAARAAIIASSRQIPLVGRGIISTGTRARLLHQLGLIEQIVDALFADTGGAMVETVAPVITDMPDFYDLLVGADPAVIGGHLRRFGQAMADHFRSLLDGVGTRLSDLAGVFDRTAAELAVNRPAARMAAFGRQTSELVGDLYDNQIRSLGERIAERGPSSFERWLVGGGFFVIGGAIAPYVQSMLRWWRDEEAAGDAPSVVLNPTSPHILLRRAQLRRVHLPRLTLRAPSRPHDEALVRDLARHLRSAVQGAYREGERRLAAMRPVEV